MGLIERIKSVLGLGASSSTSQPAASSTDGPSPGDDPGAAGDGASDDGVDVTVEHEPATASEDAVKGTDTATDSGPTTATDSTADTEIDAAAETGETGDAANDEADGTEVDESEADESTSGGAPTDPASDAELEDIKGIGPTYAERLREAGVDGVGALAEADSAALSEETDIAESRVENWVEQAKLY
jgi:predicted flap endonuclease-1-like 5' DNA nuclease